MNKVLQTILWIIVIILLILAVYFLSNPSEPISPISEEPIKIGAALSMTGKLASYGEDLKNGIGLAVEEVNQKYPFTIQVVYEDTQSEVDSAVSAARKLIDFAKVNIILGAVRSNNTLAIAPITEENKIILFSPASSSEKISQAGDYVFRNRESAKSHGIGMANFLIDKNINEVALFVAQSANSISYGEFFKTHFEELNGTINFTINYNEDNTDFRTDISKAKNSGAEAFYLAVAGGGDAGILTKQIRELGFKELITGSVAFDSDEFLETAGSTAEGIIFSSPAFDIANSNIQNYREAYKTEYDREPDAFGANAYDAVKLIAEAINQCGGDESSCIRDYLYQVKNYPGVGGLTTFDANGDVIKPIMLKTVKDGQFVKYEE